MSTPSIRIGNQTHCNIAPNLPYDFARQHGFDAFEWFSDKASAGWCEDDVTRDAREQLKREAKHDNLLFSVHTPVAAEPTSREGTQQILRSIQFAGDVGAGLVNLHLCPQQTPADFSEALGPVLAEAIKTGVQLSIENTPDCSPDAFNALFEVLAKMPEARGRIGMCLDMGHANLFHATRNDYLRYVDALGAHVPINHWHAHENWGDRDSHLTLFTGPSSQNDAGVRGLASRLLKRGFSGSIVLEQWPNPPELLALARIRLRKIIDAVWGSMMETKE